MKQNIDLCSLSINNFQPRYSDIKENSPIYPDKKTAVQYFNDSVSSIPIPPITTKKLNISDLEKVVGQASSFLHNNEKTKAKIIFKALPHLYSCINFAKTNTDQLTYLLIRLHTEFPEKLSIMYPLLLLLILRDKIESKYEFLFYHLLSIPKHLLKPSLSIFLNEKSKFIEKCFILSTFIPSFEFDIDNLTQPSDHILLPDPSHMANYLSEFTDEQISYACHIMQLCHRYLLSITKTESLEIETFIPLLYLIGSSSFTRSCFSLSLYITSQIPTENEYVIQFLQKVQDFGCITFIEELFLYNTSESFSHIIPISSNLFYQFFVTNNEHLITDMKTVMTSLCHDLKESASYLKELTIDSGNRIYLFWLYIFLIRLTSKQEEDEVKIDIIQNYWSIIQSHIQKVYLLIISAEKFRDPSISFLLNSTLYSIFNYLLIIVKEGKIGDAFISQIYDFICMSLHFIISVPISVSKMTSLGCELLKTYRCIQKLLVKQPLFFKSCIRTFSEVDKIQTPAISLAMSNIHIPISFISKLADLLILADEPTCFYCLSTLINSCQKLNELSIFLIQFFHNLIYLKEHREFELQQKILMRFFLLLCSVILNNNQFAKSFVTCSHFEAFDNLFRKLINSIITTKDANELQEAVVFFLWSLYRSFSENEEEKSKFSYFDPYPIELFQKFIDHFTENGATVLLEAIIDYLNIHQCKAIPFTIHFHHINLSHASNIAWFTEIITNFNGGIDIGQLKRPKPNNYSLSLPWRQNCIYSRLLSLSNYGVEFQKITKKEIF